MKTRMVTLATAGMVLSAGVAAASGPTMIDPATRARSMLNAAINGGTIGSPDNGCDVIVGELMQTQNQAGAMGVNLAPLATIGTVSAYSVGTTSCNIGTQDMNWIANTNDHPVIAQNYYRLKDGRLEQIGIGWLKHGFTALTYNACSNEGYTCNGHGGAVLGVGCSDPYSSSLNGSQGGLGPRFEVNPYNGLFPYPFTSPPVTNGLSRRIQINHSDIEDSVLFPNTRYFAEGQYVSLDEANGGLGPTWNNASYRRMTVNGTTRVFTLQDQTVRRKPAIHAWKDYGGPGGTADPNVILNAYDIAGDGRFWFGSKATNLGGGMWHYEYALQNLNSHRAAGSITVPVPECANVSNVGFHDVTYHSGEPFVGTDWAFTRIGGQASWASETHAANINANAVRWGTMYSYRFDSNLPPKTNGTITIGLFRPPTAGSPATSFDAAGVVPRFCTADMNESCSLTIADFSAFQALFVAQDPRADFNGDGQFTIGDFIAYQAAYVAGCS